MPSQSKPPVGREIELAVAREQTLVHSKADYGTATEAVPLSSLRPAPWNPRTIKQERFLNLCQSILDDPEFLRLRPVLAQADGEIYAGSMRYRAATYLGLEAIPAIIGDVSEQVARERSLRDNAQWGEWQEEDLSALLRELEGDGSRIDLLGLDAGELQRLLDSLKSSGELGDPESVPELPGAPVAKPGDLWCLGPHRVLCGDATSPRDVASVMKGEKAACVWTDPACGVAYVGSTKQALTIQNDDAAGLESLLTGAFSAVDVWLQAGAAIYVAHAAGPLSLTFGNCFVGQGWNLRQTLIWVTDSPVMGRSDYRYRHEQILFGYKAGPGRRGRGGQGWYGGNDLSSVFEIPRPKASPEHPTMKPVALIAAMIRNSSRSGEIILDPFLGSGSTLIAAHILGRRCCGLELDPKYVDVIVRRWERFTGQHAILANQPGSA